MIDRLSWALAGVAALVLLGATSTEGAAQGASVPEECMLPGLSAAEQARCDFIARTPDLCERPNLSGRTRAFCDGLRDDAADCRLSERTCAAEGVVLIARDADRLVIWRRTDFRAFSLRWFRPRLLEGLGSEQTVTLLLGPDDLYRPRLEQLAQLIFERGGAVIVTDATLDDADQLRQLLDVNGAAWHEDQGTARLYGLRQVIEDDERIHLLSFVLFSDPDRGPPQFHLPLDPSETEWLLARIGQNPPVLDAPEALLGADAMNNIYDLSSATVGSQKSSAGGQSIELDNTVIAARSLDPVNWTDHFAVQQKVLSTCTAAHPIMLSVSSQLDPQEGDVVVDDLLVEEQLPGSVSGDTYQTGVTYPPGGTFAGAVGYPRKTTSFSGFDVTLQDAQIVFPTVTTDVPAGASVGPGSDPLDWELTPGTTTSVTSATLSTSWLWIAPNTAYAAEGGSRNSVLFDLDTTATASGCASQAVPATLSIPLSRPFPTAAAETPVVDNSGILPTEVTVGEEFTIRGSGFYPSIITDVQIAGSPIETNAWTANTDEQITVTAPTLDASLYGRALAVEVDTTSGNSNSDQTVTIIE